MKFPSVFALVILLISTNSLATPVVNGNTISWPDDGWYQVQLVEGANIQEVCAGGRECDVAPGEYIVINHTTGDRFTGITILDSEGPTDSESPITVLGNTISWPDDGWYQVQTANDYVEVCSGGRLCDVTRGTYVVINHSTGTRYENIEVEGGSSAADTPNPELVVDVNQLTISWPDNGWYQVQNSESYVTECEGTRSCVVEPGSYNVINHTTGQRVENVLIVAPEPLQIDPSLCNEGLSSNHLTVNCIGAEAGISVSYSLAENSRSFGEFDVKNMGDFNGDGYPDMLVPFWDGATYGAFILLGSAQGWNSDIEINDLTAIQAESLNQDRIVTFSDGWGNAFHIGDINADGYSDIGFPFSENVRIIFGRANAGAQTFSLASDSTDIDLIIETNMSVNHTSVAPAGDFNGDGIDDFILAIDNYSTLNEFNQRTFGALFILYGRASFDSVIALDAMESTDGKIFLPGDPTNRFAYKSTGVGDVDADGFDDILFSDKETGATYLVYGGEVVDDFQYRLDDASVPNMTRLINSASTPVYVYRGRAVSGGGDFNGDGFADFAIMQENTLESIDIVFGRAERFPSTFEVNTETSSEGFAVSDDGDKVWTGALDLTSDINGDGLSDLIIGSETTDNRRGAVYIIFGTTDNRNRRFGDTSDDGVQLITGVEENYRLGSSVHSLDDINGDGIGDVSIGVGNYFAAEESSIVVFGTVQ